MFQQPVDATIGSDLNHNFAESAVLNHKAGARTGGRILAALMVGAFPH